MTTFATPSPTGFATNIVTGNNIYTPNAQNNPMSETSAISIAAAAAAAASQFSYNDVATAAPTLTAAQMVGGAVDLTTQTTAQTVTTDTAANIVALVPNLQIGSTFDFILKNSYPAAAAVATLAAGSGVTIDSATVIPPGAALFFKAIVTNATAGSYAVTLYNVSLPATADAKYSTAALQSAVIPAANLTGAKIVAFDNTGTTPANLQVDTAANIINAIPNAFVGQSYLLKIRNSSGSANTATITTNTGVTLTGTMTIAQTVTRDFIVTVTSATTVTLQSIGISAAGA